jgi:hypothetical protein
LWRQSAGKLCGTVAYKESTGQLHAKRLRSDSVEERYKAVAWIRKTE